MIRRRLGPRVPFLLLILLSCSTAPVLVSAASVTLGLMEIFQTHEWILSKPTVYFQCKGEDMIILPDVKEINISYTFRGEESWQPLTEFQENKCKRCGFYEKDPINSDEFDEWELCPSDFTSSGIYLHSKDSEFNATFVCPGCVPIGKGPHDSSAPKTDSKSGSNQLHWAIIAAITIVGSVVFIAGLVSICKYYQKRKKQQQQARFLKLFEDTDDMEDELGIGPLSHAI